jgi:hypothetical protein
VRVREFERYAKEHLLPVLPQFEIKRGRLFESPIDDLLRGFGHQPSNFSRTGFYLSSFVQPLYVPNDVIIGPVGDRTGPWQVDEDSPDDVRAFVEQALVSLNSVRTPADLVEWLQADLKEGDDPHRREELAYSLILTGDVAAARRQIDAAIASTEDLIAETAYLFADTDEDEPLLEVVGRLRQVGEKLESDVREARRLLCEWRLLTARNLGVAEYLRDPSSAGCGGR